MNNQIILPMNRVVFIKIKKNNKINSIKIILNLKYIWKVLISWYLFWKEKSKPVWVQSRAQLILKELGRSLKNLLHKQHLFQKFGKVIKMMERVFGRR